MGIPIWQANDSLKQAASIDLFALQSQLESRGIKKVSVKPRLTISHSDVEVTAITQKKPDEVEITVNGFGLVGASSPLPHYFLHAILSCENASGLLQFISFINARLYELLYCAFKKSNAAIAFNHPRTALLRYLRRLSGDLLVQTDASAHAFANLFATRSHNAISLQGMLHDYLDKLPVTINQFLPRWVKIDAPCRLQNQSSIALGDNSFIGSEVVDTTSKVTLTIGPLRIIRALTLLPHTQTGQQLMSLVRRYLGQHICYQVTLRVIPELNLSQTLGKHAIPLGWASWVGELQQTSYTIAYAGY